MIKLGSEGKDKITGFKGIISARHIYLTGCDQYTITPPLNKEGTLGDQYQFDEDRIEVIGPGINKEEVSNKENPGGPQRESKEYK